MSKSRRPRESESLDPLLPPPPMSRVIRVEEIKDDGDIAIEATAAERATIAQLLELAALDKFAMAGTLRRRGGGRVVLKGELVAEATQTCVVSLEPVAAQLRVPVELEFWPAAAVQDFVRSAEEGQSHEIVEWPEPISIMRRGARARTSA